MPTVVPPKVNPLVLFVMLSEAEMPVSSAAFRSGVVAVPLPPAASTVKDSAAEAVPAFPAASSTLAVIWYGVALFARSISIAHSRAGVPVNELSVADAITVPP